MKKVLVSACLLGENCKYNGGNNRNEKLLEFLKDKEVIPVCPEVLGGLPTPRTPCELIDEKVIDQEGLDKTLEYTIGAIKTLESALVHKVEYAILKSKSPSCGKDGIYDGTFTHTVVKKDGITVRLLKENNIKIYTENDIENGNF